MATRKHKGSAQKLGESLAIELARGLHRARAQLVSHADRAAKLVDLEAAHISMLHVLGLRGPMRMGDLAARMVIRPASMTRRAKQLEERGLVTRERSTASNREVVIRLTDAGADAFETTFGAVHDDHAQYFDDNLTEAQQRKLFELLSKLP